MLMYPIEDYRLPTPSEVFNNDNLIFEILETIKRRLDQKYLTIIPNPDWVFSVVEKRLNEILGKSGWVISEYNSIERPGDRGYTEWRLKAIS